MDEPTIKAIFFNLLSPQNTERKAAEDAIKALDSVPGFLIAVLQLIHRLCSSADPRDSNVRQSAAVYFKNAVKKRWCPPEDSSEIQISPEDGAAIKTHLVELMCSTPPNVQKQLAEAVSIISKYDFPEKWQSLLPQLVSKLGTTDIQMTKGVMVTANNIMKRFRHEFKSDPLFEILKVCLDQFQEPLLVAYRHNGQAIESFAANKENLLIVMESQRLMTRIFFSLNFQDLPEFFEDHMAEWMSEFSKYLQYENALLVNTSAGAEAGAIENLQAAIIENLNLYATKYEEEFTPYLSTFTQTIWAILSRMGPQSKYEVLATNAIKFLTSVSSKEMNRGLFTDEILKDIVEHIVIKNLTASQDDEDLFEDNPTDYIRKDMEGSDQDTRRRCAMEFVRTLLKFFGDQVSQLCVSYIGAMLAHYQTGLDWKAKDAALHLVLAVSVMSSSTLQGAGELNPRVNIQEIFATQVLPEIRDPDVNARPIVKADAIKMLCIFRTHLPAPFLLELLPDVIRHLNSESVVLQTYAATCIERFLSIKDRDPTTGISSSRITKEHIGPIMEPLFMGLFNVLDNPDLTENDYVMKCMMRSLAVLESGVESLIPIVLPRLTTALARVCKNPSNPHFNHYLFECLAIFIRSTCTVPNPEAAAAAGAQFEQYLSPHFLQVLSQNVEDFFPYVFQIYGLLLGVRPVGSGLSETYATLLPMLLHPSLWNAKGNVPALSELMRAYAHVGMGQIVSSGQLEATLGVFQKLLAAKFSEEYAFKLLEALITYGPITALQPYLPEIFTMLLTRMQEQMTTIKTPKYCSLFLHCIMFFANTYGGQALFDTFECVGSGLLGTVIVQVWSFNRGACATAGDREVKYMIAGATKVLCESPISGNPTAWGELLKSIATLLGANPDRAVDVDDNFLLDDADGREFDTSYSRLAYAQVPEPPLTQEVAAAPLFFASSLAALTAARPGTYGPVVQSALDASELAVVQATLASAGVRLA